MQFFDRIAHKTLRSGPIRKWKILLRGIFISLIYRPKIENRTYRKNFRKKTSKFHKTAYPVSGKPFGATWFLEIKVPANPIKVYKIKIVFVETIIKFAKWLLAIFEKIKPFMFWDSMIHIDHHLIMPDVAALYTYFFIRAPFLLKNSHNSEVLNPHKNLQIVKYMKLTIFLEWITR